MTEVGSPAALPLRYPETRREELVEDHFGVPVADPYRWLEDPDCAETCSWVAAQNALTHEYLAAIPERARIRERLAALWAFERRQPPERRGPWYLFTIHDGVRPQPVLYRARNLDDPEEVLLDPNELSDDGTTSLAAWSASRDGRWLAYALQHAGSDWLEWRVREIASGQDLPDVIERAKFSGAAWLPDGSGFVYGRYPPDPSTDGQGAARDSAPLGARCIDPADGDGDNGALDGDGLASADADGSLPFDDPRELTAPNRHHQLALHRLGQDPGQDEVVFARPDEPDWIFEPEVTDDGRWLLVYQSQGTDPRQRIFLQDLSRPGSTIEPFLDRFDAAYRVIDDEGERFFVLTDLDAPRRRLVAVDRAHPEPEAWTTLIPEGPRQEVLSAVTAAGGRLLCVWGVDACDRLEVRSSDGALERAVKLPALGSVTTIAGRREDPEAAFGFTSFIHAPTVHRLTMAAGPARPWHPPDLPHHPDDYETRQVFTTSRDGTRVPMFLTARRGTDPDGARPTYLYGYGGFDIPVTPTFAPATIAWLEMGGVYAVANLRGGGEYGRAWHDAGRLANKQNVFDDCIGAAEWLIDQGWTRPERLAIGGRSNGGLLAGACLTQRPDLFGAALPAVGVMDMLRFSRFTIGWAWTSDYGDPEVEADFRVLLAYSPLHNIRPGTRYPATLLSTADHDDRVVPAHSYKFAAALQAAQAGPAPVLIRIETRAGHGAGMPTHKLIDEAADRWAFLVNELGMGDGR
jgi:prolyl oligopeptidase